MARRRTSAISYGVAITVTVVLVELLVVATVQYLIIEYFILAARERLRLTIVLAVEVFAYQLKIVAKLKHEKAQLTNLT